MKMNRKEIQLAITEKTLNFWQQAEAFYNVTLPMVQIKFDLIGRTAGEAHFKERLFGGWEFKLRFNIGIAEKQLEDYLAVTVPHEIAHLVAVFQYRETGHGKAWKKIMTECFGITEPARCHKFKTESARRTFFYKCACREHELTSIIHNRITKGRKYHCKDCKGTLTFSGI